MDILAQLQTFDRETLTRIVRRALRRDQPALEVRASEHQRAAGGRRLRPAKAVSAAPKPERILAPSS